MRPITDSQGLIDIDRMLSENQSGISLQLLFTELGMDKEEKDHRETVRFLVQEAQKLLADLRQVQRWLLVLLERLEGLGIKPPSVGAMISASDYIAEIADMPGLEELASRALHSLYVHGLTTAGLSEDGPIQITAKGRTTLDNPKLELEVLRLDQPHSHVTLWRFLKAENFPDCPASHNALRMHLNRAEKAGRISPVVGGGRGRGRQKLWILSDVKNELSTSIKRTSNFK